MQITLIVIGKTDDKRIEELTAMYAKRLSHYVKFDLEIIPDLKKVKNLSESQQKEKEGQALLARLKPTDFLMLLDENGKQYDSVGFSEVIQKQLNSGIKRLVFAVGGPYGFSPEVYQKAQGKLALSKMTFSHQMVRPFFTEQLYRAFTILKNEPYHHR
ncbi:MAG: 23S rRNA (pseudouridine(1915)-N(3))-methyltransferase RlmH [Gilvibacter sp.]